MYCCGTIWNRGYIPPDQRPVTILYKWTDATGHSGLQFTEYFSRAKDVSMMVERGGKVYTAVGHDDGFGFFEPIFISKQQAIEFFNIRRKE